jgi:hypothetical protein
MLIWFGDHNIKRNYVKIISESCEFDFTPINSLPAGFNRSAGYLPHQARYTGVLEAWPAWFVLPVKFLTCPRC